MQLTFWDLSKEGETPALSFLCRTTLTAVEVNVATEISSCDDIATTLYKYHFDGDPVKRSEGSKPRVRVRPFPHVAVHVSHDFRTAQLMMTMNVLVQLLLLLLLFEVLTRLCLVSATMHSLSSSSSLTSKRIARVVAAAYNEMGSCGLP
eukprot:PhM_4_TR13354/c5_g1_i2/m.14087